MVRELGIGLSHARGLEPLCAAGTELVQVLEVEPQTFWMETFDPVDPYQVDQGACERIKGLPQVKLVHGIGFPVGGSRAPDPRHLPVFAQAVVDFDAAWASEHLSFNLAGGPSGTFNTGFLMPPRQTWHGVDAAATTIRSTQAGLPVPFAVETGVNYLRPRPDELPDGLFVGAVAESADCGLLLDLHNVWTNERNGRQSVTEFLGQLPLERVWELHLAGGSELDGYWIDSHSGPVPDDVMDLAAEVIPQLHNLGAIIFEVFPSYLPRLDLHVIEAQLERLHELWSLRPRASIRPPQPSARELGHPTRTVGDDPMGDVRAWEDTLGQIVVGLPTRGSLGAEIGADHGTDIVRSLLKDFRAGMVCDALRLTVHLLLLTVGEEALRSMLAEFGASQPPALFRSTEGEAFGDYLSGLDLKVEYLPEIVAYERGVLRTLTTGQATDVAFPYDPLPVLRALAGARMPQTPRAGNFVVSITPDDCEAIRVEGIAIT